MTWGAALRWSFSSRAWCGLCAILSHGRVYVRHELTWFEQSPEEAAIDLRRLMRDRKIPALTYLTGNPEMFPQGQETGPTDSEIFAMEGFPMRRGTKDRINGWSRMRAWMQSRAETGPSLFWHPDCDILTRTLPTLISDEREPDEVSGELVPSDVYPAEALMHFVQSRPMPWREEPEKKPVDPLSGAALWAQLREGESGHSRYVGWNRRVTLR